MTHRIHAALGIWRARHPQTTGDRVYFVYLLFLVLLISGVPVARLLWLGLLSEPALTALGSEVAPVIAHLSAVALWSGMLLIGRARGPAVLTPFLIHAFSTSDVPRRRALRGPVVRSGTALALIVGDVAGVIAGSMLAGSLVDVHAMLLFAAAGLAVGVIAAVMWLLGQVFPRAATPVALGVIVVGAGTAVIPALAPFTPWGWFGMLYPTASAPPVLALVGLIVLAIAAVASVPALLDRLDHATLTAQSARWDSATVHAAGMDFSLAASVYTARPRGGRRLRAVRPGTALWLMFLRRGAVGALRTPGRLVSGIVGLALAALLVVCGHLPGAVGWIFGVTAGVVMFVAAGPVTDGIRHAAHVASDLPLYGIGDRGLLALHALFPALVTVIVTAAAAGGTAAAFGLGPAGVPMAVLLGLLALIGRINNALKGPMPPSLLTPIPSPMGDMAALLRLGWALDGALLAALCGVGVVLANSSPLMLVVLVVWQAGITVSRWRERR